MMKNPLLWILILILPTFIWLLRPGFFPMQDDLQAFRLQQMTACFADWQLPCRWIPDMGYQYGYPQFIFYSPLVFYIGQLFHLVGLQFIDIVKLLFVLGFVSSGWAMYLFLRQHLTKLAATVGAILYVYAPFRAAEVYVRGSLSEFAALTFFPLLFWSSYRLIQKPTKGAATLFGFILAGSLLTHNLMNLIFLPIVGIWMVSWIILEKRWPTLRALVLAGLLGFALSAFYIVPLAFERQYVHLETLTSGYFDYRQHFVDLNQLFISNYFDYGSSVLGPADEVSLSTGQIHWLLALLGLSLSIYQWKKKKAPLAVVIIVLSVVELGVLFMMHQRSSFIWSMLPFLKMMQFPWRFLADSIFLLSFIGAVAIYWLEQMKLVKLSYLLSAVAVGGVMLLHLTFFQPKEWFAMTDAQKFSGPLWQKQLTISIFDYLPIYAKFPPNHAAPELPEILDGQARVEDYRKGSNFQQGKVTVVEDATIRLPLFDYPGMKVIANDQLVTHHHDECRGQEYCFGQISFHLPKGEYQLKAQLVNTPDRMIGDLLTVGGLLTAVLLIRRRHAKI